MRGNPYSDEVINKEKTIVVGSLRAHVDF